jgi:AraC-like DNA-binding protein
MTAPDRTTPRPARGAGRGQICSWPGGVLWIGTSDVAGAVHSHHAIQLGFGPDEPLHFRTAEDAEWVAYRGSIIPADLPHALDGSGRRSAIVFVDPESPEGVGLQARTAPGSIAHLPDADASAATRRIFDAWERSHDCASLVSATRAAVAELAGTAARAPSADPRVLGAIELIRARLDRRVTLTDVARELNVSPSRLRHLFVEEVGLPFRTYVLWQRLQRVIQGMGTEPLTKSALSAGFADAAHMTRTFRRMLGFPPSMFARE